MIRDKPVPLADDSAGCVLETTPRNIQRQRNPSMFYVSLNRDWLAQFNICTQGAATVHSMAMRPVEVTKPAIIIQPAELIQE